MKRVLFDGYTHSVREADTGKFVCKVSRGHRGEELAREIVAALNRDLPPLPTAAEVRGIFKGEKHGA